MTNSQTLLFQIYKKFYQQRSVLQTAPTLTINMDSVSIENFDVETADKELAKMISFLLGIQDVTQIQWEEALLLVEKYYKNQPQWNKLILDYFSYVLEKEKEQLAQEQIDLLKEVLNNLEEE